MARVEGLKSFGDETFDPRYRLLGAVQWPQRHAPPGAQESAMHPTSRQVTRKTHRTARFSVSPYHLDEVGLTLAEIRLARAEISPGASR